MLLRGSILAGAVTLAVFGWSQGATGLIGTFSKP